MTPKELKRELQKRKWKEVKSCLKSLMRSSLLVGEEEEKYLTIKGHTVWLTRVK